MSVKVSVIMSVYNGEKYVKTSVESILTQTFKNFELIIINDGSTDRTPDLLGSYQDARIRIIHQENLGLTKSLNKGISLAHGEYIARMDADDISFPRRLERQVQFMEDNLDIGVVGTAYYEIDDQGRIVGKRVFPLSDDRLRKALIRYNPLFHGSVMIRRTVFERVGLYNECFLKSQDYELWFRVAKHFRLANLPEPLMMRRYGAANISVASEREQIAFALRARLRAIREGQYPWYYIVYLTRPLIAMNTPALIKNHVRKHILKSKRW